MKKVIKLFTWAHCPYCKAAIRLLDERGLNYSEIDIHNNSQKRRELQVETGHYTVPFIFIGETFIGGYSELRDSDFSGELKSMLE
jgi:glutaredoxin 3